MSRRTHRLVPMAAAILALAAAAAVAASDAPRVAASDATPVARKGRFADRAKEVVVLVRPSEDGKLLVTPDTAYVRSGQKLVLFACCEKLEAKFLEKVERIPGFHCEGGECTLVAPYVPKPTSVGYTVWGTCHGRPFGKDPILIFIP